MPVELEIFYVFFSKLVYFCFFLLVPIFLCLYKFNTGLELVMCLHQLILKSIIFVVVFFVLNDDF